jgi:hypothetical protein
VPRFALLQPGRHSVGAVTGLVDKIGGHAGLVGTLSHRPEFLAKRAQATCYPLLLGCSLLGEFTSGLLHKLLDLMRGFGGHLAGLLACYAGYVFSGVARCPGDLSSLIFCDVGGRTFCALCAESRLRDGCGNLGRIATR